MYFSTESMNSSVFEQHLLLLPHTQQWWKCTWSIILHSLKHWWSPAQRFPHVPLMVPCFYLLAAKTFFIKKCLWFPMTYVIFDNETTAKYLSGETTSETLNFQKCRLEQHVNSARPCPSASPATAILTSQVILELKGLGFPLLKAANLGNEILPLLTLPIILTCSPSVCPDKLIATIPIPTFNISEDLGSFPFQKHLAKWG